MSAHNPDLFFNITEFDYKKGKYRFQVNPLAGVIREFGSNSIISSIKSIEANTERDISLAFDPLKVRLTPEGVKDIEKSMQESYILMRRLADFNPQRQDILR